MPLIDEYAFGRMRVAGKPMRHDVTIVSGRARDGWWRKSGHLATRADLDEIFRAGPGVLVIGTGSSGMMRVDEGVRREAGRLGIRLVAEPTARAVETFNRLYDQGAEVAGAFHLTC